MKATFGEIQEFIRVNGETLDSVLWINGIDIEDHKKSIDNGHILISVDGREKSYLLLEGKWFLEGNLVTDIDRDIFNFLKFCNKKLV